MISLSIARPRDFYSRKSTRAVMLLSIAFQYPEGLLRNLTIAIIGWEQTLHHGRRWWKKASRQSELKRKAATARRLYAGDYLFPNRRSVESLMFSWPFKGCVQVEEWKTRRVEAVSPVPTSHASSFDEINTHLRLLLGVQEEKFMIFTNLHRGLHVHIGLPLKCGLHTNCLN